MSDTLIKLGEEVNQVIGYHKEDKNIDSQSLQVLQLKLLLNIVDRLECLSTEQWELHS